MPIEGSNSSDVPLNVKDAIDLEAEMVNATLLIRLRRPPRPA